MFEEPPAAQGDEGRAMLQIVHDIAPGASLSFVTALGSEAFMATGIRTLADTGADVIVDDVIYYSEPMFQDGVIANAIHDAALFEDVTYFSMAFNANIISGTNNRLLRGARVPPGRDLPRARLPSYAEQCMDFNPADGEDATYGISVPSGETVKLGLQWAQPLGGVATDLDAYLIGTGLAEAPKSENTNVITQRPFEFVSYQNTTGVGPDIGLVINRYTGDEGGNGASPRLKLVLRPERWSDGSRERVHDLRRRRHRRPGHLRPQRHGGRADGRGGAVQQLEYARGLLLARTGHALLRRGERTWGGGGPGDPGGPQQARRRGDRRRDHELLRHR